MVWTTIWIRRQKQWFSQMITRNLSLRSGPSVRASIWSLILLSVLHVMAKMALVLVPGTTDVTIVRKGHQECGMPTRKHLSLLLPRDSKRDFEVTRPSII